jgi:hypothetical protein
MARLKKGAALLCVPCGREVVVRSEGVAATTIWCCGRPMKSAKAVKGKAKKGLKAKRGARRKSSKK